MILDDIIEIARLQYPREMAFTDDMDRTNAGHLAQKLLCRVAIPGVAGFYMDGKPNGFEPKLVHRRCFQVAHDKAIERPLRFAIPEWLTYLEDWPTGAECKLCGLTTPFAEEA